MIPFRRLHSSVPSNSTLLFFFFQQVIYVARNPKDVVSSYFNLTSKMYPHRCPPWEQYLENFMEGCKCPATGSISAENQKGAIAIDLCTTITPFWLSTDVVALKGHSKSWISAPIFTTKCPKSQIRREYRRQYSRLVVNFVVNIGANIFTTSREFRRKYWRRYSRLTLRSRNFIVNTSMLANINDEIQDESWILAPIFTTNVWNRKFCRESMCALERPHRPVLEINTRPNMRSKSLNMCE